MLFALAVALSTAAAVSFVADPALGVILLFIAKPIVDANWGTVLFLGMPLTQVVAGMVPMCMLVHMAVAKPDASIARMPFKWLWVTYAGYLCTTVWLTIGQGDPLLGANVTLRTLNGLAGFYMVQAFFHDGRRLKHFLYALVVAGLFPIGVGIYQVATGVAWRVEFQEIEGLMRNVGMYHDVIMVRHVAFQTALALLLIGALTPALSVFHKWAGSLYLAAAALVMFKAYSKAGFVILVLWTVSWTLLQRQTRTFLLAVGVAILCGAYMATSISGDVATIFQKELGFLGGQVEADRTLNGRWYLWQDLVTEWSSAPWSGRVFGTGKVGLGAHNDYLQILFHGGLIGLTLYLLLLVSIGFRIVKNLRRRIDPLAVAAFMVFLSWMVDTIGLVPSAYSGYQWFVWGVIGLSMRMRQEQERQGLKREVVRPAPPAVTASTVIDARRFPLVAG